MGLFPPGFATGLIYMTEKSEVIKIPEKREDKILRTKFGPEPKMTVLIHSRILVRVVSLS